LEETKSRDVVICRGIGDLTEPQFKQLGEVWERYVNDGIVTATSPLLYKINEHGKFEAFGNATTALEQKTQDYLAPKGAKVLPHVWCDASCCDNCKLPGSVMAAMARKSSFFQESIQAAKKFGWNGYALDFEGEMPDAEKTTRFFKEWRQALAKEQLELHLWTGSGADEAYLAKLPEQNGSVPMSSAIDMSTYNFDRATDSEEIEDDSLQQKRSARRTALLQETSSSPSAHGMYCPPRSKVQTSFKAKNVSSLQQTDGDFASQTGSGALRARELNDQMMDWCASVGKHRCAFGLITYDLQNADMSCHDIGQVAQGALKQQVGSIWIWSGGIIGKKWEPGLSQYLSGVNAPVNCNQQQPSVESQRALGHANSLPTRFIQKMKQSAQRSLYRDDEASDERADVAKSSACGASSCEFDSHFCCNGMGKSKI
jgi:hypothetical protein